MYRLTQRVYPMVHGTGKHLYLQESRYDCIRWCDILGYTFAISVLVLSFCMIISFIALLAKTDLFIYLTFWVLTGVFTFVGGVIGFIYKSTNTFYSEIEYQYDDEK